MTVIPGAVQGRDRANLSCLPPHAGLLPDKSGCVALLTLIIYGQPMSKPRYPVSSLVVGRKKWVPMVNMGLPRLVWRQNLMHLHFDCQGPPQKEHTKAVGVNMLPPTAGP